MPTNKAIIVDIDGTLANVDHRLKFIHQEPKDWDSFHKSCIHDTPHQWCYDLVQLYKEKGYSIILLTGRGEEFRALSLKWLEENEVPFDHLFMRGKADRRADDLIKKEIYENHIKPDYDISFVVEDRKSVVAMWREIGLTCLQCAWGDF